MYILVIRTLFCLFPALLLFPRLPRAATADSSGRRRLATLLLDFEPRVRDQVPILLKMREGRLALEKVCT